MKKHHVIYVPGILDDIYHAQGLLVRTWRLHGLRGHTHEMPWAGEEAYEPKLQRLLDKIDKHAARGDKVSLVGASAGASAVINAYVERRDKVTGLILICAKINGPETVSSKTYSKNPAFKTSMQVLQSNLRKLTAEDKTKMRSFYSSADKTVPYEAVTIPGVAEEKLPALPHARAILYSLGPGAHRLADFILNV